MLITCEREMNVGKYHVKNCRIIFEKLKMNKSHGGGVIKRKQPRGKLISLMINESRVKSCDIITCGLKA